MPETELSKTPTPSSSPTVAADPTRAKLIAAAGEVFAEVGFHSATVRDICRRAGANVAAINYHFRDKLGLYTEVLRESICANQGEIVKDAVAKAKTPEETLRLLIAGMLRRMYAEDRPAWNFRIMAHEMAQPTPVLGHVINEVLRPRYDQLRGIIGQILHLSPDHPTTRLYSHSVIGQVIHYVHARPVIAILWPNLNLSEPKDRQLVANHIADFTLHDLHALALQNKKREKSK
jgi:AcrR family transcriptional regulator